MDHADRKPIIVYPIKKNGSKWENTEFRLSLRSLANWATPGFEHTVYVLSVEDLPWLNPAHATQLQIRGYVEAVKKAIALAKEHSPTGVYVWMNDDIMFLKPSTPADLVPVRHMGSMTPNKGETDINNGWRRKLIGVRDLLAEYGWPTMNFSTHTPYLFNAERMEQTIALFGLEYKTALETAYYNMWSHLYPCFRGKDRLTWHTPRTLPPCIDHKRFLNISDGGLKSDEIKGFVQGLFPRACRYEKEMA